LVGAGPMLPTEIVVMGREARQQLVSVIPQAFAIQLGASHALPNQRQKDFAATPNAASLFITARALAVALVGLHRVEQRP
ncbi:hypothetical protein, partial [Chromohalobacter sp. HP20-39]|uniref:hypothetical protein n=1 Tax=Chromohalobacter sp. HP20-39 TaxID=3079306 RepID=UPI00294AEA6E